MACLCDFLFAASRLAQAQSDVRKLKIPVQTATADRLIDAGRLVRSSARRYPKAVGGTIRLASFNFSGHRHPRARRNKASLRLFAFSLVSYDAIHGTGVAFDCSACAPRAGPRRKRSSSLRNSNFATRSHRRTVWISDSTMVKLTKNTRDTSKPISNTKDFSSAFHPVVPYTLGTARHRYKSSTVKEIAIRKIFCLKP